MKAQVWIAAPVECPLNDYSSYLSSEECERMLQFRCEADRRAYLASHGLVRTALTACVPAIQPAAWRFVRTAAGRPEIAAPAVERPLRFSLTRTRDLVACVVVPEIDCGIDLESIGRCANLDVGDLGVVAPRERARLLVLSADLRLREFVRYWTLKEAYAKARGLGLSLPFSQIAFNRDRVGFYLEYCAGDRASGCEWQFEQRDLRAGHVLSAAFKSSQRLGCSLIFHASPPAVPRDT